MLTQVGESGSAAPDGSTGGGNKYGGGPHGRSVHNGLRAPIMAWPHAASSSNSPDMAAASSSWHDVISRSDLSAPLSVGAPSGAAQSPAPGKKPSAKKSSKKDVFICAEVHCGKQFPRSFALRRHMRIHTGNKPYACDYDGCTQRFNTSGNLSRHKRIHSGERPYPCIFATCGKRFNTSTKLKRHMRIHFPEGQNLFRCIGVNCTWSCDNYKEFAQHQKLHHNIIVGAAQSLSHPLNPLNQQHQQQQQQQQRHDQDMLKSDPEYFHPEGHHHARVDAYDSLVHQQQQQPATAGSSGSFLYNSVFAEKPKPPAPSRKLMGQFFGGGDMNLSNLPTMLQKDQKKVQEIDHVYASSDARRTSSSNSKPGIAGHSAFPLGEYHHHHARTGPYESSTFSLSAESSSYAPSSRAPSFGSHHYAHLRSGNSSDDEYDDQHRGSGNGGHQQQHHHHSSPPSHHVVLRPPPQHEDNMKFGGGFSVPPPMNPAAPEFTGEELSVVLELMKDSYC